MTNKSLTTTAFYDMYSSIVAVDQASSGFSKDFTAPQTVVGQRPKEYTPASALKAIRNDEAVYASIVTKVDACLAGGHFFKGTNQTQLKELRKTFDSGMGHLFLRHLLFNLIPLGNAFVEIVSKDEFYVLETTEMEIIDLMGHGEPDRYQQRHLANVVSFSPEQIVHFRLDRLDTSLWAEVPLKAIDKVIGIKLQVKDHLWRIFKDNLFRDTIHFPATTVEDDVNRSLVEYKATQQDRSKPYIWFGDGVTHEFLMTFDDGPRFIELLSALNHAILIQMQVPPIMAGFPDASGRADGEQQTYKAFNTHIRSLQRVVESYMNSEFLPKLGYPSVTFHFGELDKKTEKDVLEMAERLKTMGAKADKLIEWMSDQGIDLPKDFFQEEAFKIADPTKPAPGNGGTGKSMDMFPSRRGNNGDMNKRIGTGSDGSTRSDQLVDQAATKYQVLDEAILRRAKELLE